MHYMTTVYYCWVCEKQVDLQVYTDEHYETARQLTFCSAEHHAEYQELKALLQGAGLFSSHGRAAE